jgi:hypothetical protein
MAVVERQVRGGNYISFSARMREAQHEVLTDYAWKKRKSLSFVVSRLLEKALKAECGEPYIPEEWENEQTKPSAL